MSDYELWLIHFTNLKIKVLLLEELGSTKLLRVSNSESVWYHAWDTKTGWNLICENYNQAYEHYKDHVIA